MYRIIKIDGTELGITDSVNYIRYGDNGCFPPAPREDAIGVAFKSVAVTWQAEDVEESEGVAYNLVGHEDIEGAGTVVVSEIDGGQELKSHQTTIEGLIRTILEG